MEDVMTVKIQEIDQPPLIVNAILTNTMSMEVMVPAKNAV